MSRPLLTVVASACQDCGSTVPATGASRVYLCV